MILKMILDFFNSIIDGTYVAINNLGLEELLLVF